MAYPEDVVKLYRISKLRSVALVLAVSCVIAEHLFALPWLAWPRVAAWLLTTVITCEEARTLKRMGRDNDGAWLRAAVALLVTIHAAVTA